MTKTYKICTLPGDGIGPEIMAEGVQLPAVEAWSPKLASRMA